MSGKPRPENGVEPMMKTTLAALVVANLSLAINPLHAAATNLDAGLVIPAITNGLARAAAAQGGAGQMPPSNYAGQTWRTPNNCDYSRAGRPGEVVWYLISNTAHKGCEIMIVQKSFGDVYQ